MVHAEYSDSECDDIVAEHYEQVVYWQALQNLVVGDIAVGWRRQRRQNSNETWDGLDG